MQSAQGVCLHSVNSHADIFFEYISVEWLIKCTFKTKYLIEIRKSRILWSILHDVFSVCRAPSSLFPTSLVTRQNRSIRIVHPAECVPLMETGSNKCINTIKPNSLCLAYFIKRISLTDVNAIHVLHLAKRGICCS